MDMHTRRKKFKQDTCNQPTSHKTTSSPETTTYCKDKKFKLKNWDIKDLISHLFYCDMTHHPTSLRVISKNW